MSTADHELCLVCQTRETGCPASHLWSPKCAAEPHSATFTIAHTAIPLVTKLESNIKNGSIQITHVFIPMASKAASRTSRVPAPAVLGCLCGAPLFRKPWRKPAQYATNHGCSNTCRQLLVHAVSLPIRRTKGTSCCLHAAGSFLSDACRTNQLHQKRPDCMIYTSHK